MRAVSKRATSYPPVRLTGYYDLRGFCYTLPPGGMRVVGDVRLARVRVGAWERSGKEGAEERGQTKEIDPVRIS